MKRGDKIRIEGLDHPVTFVAFGVDAGRNGIREIAYIRDDRCGFVAMLSVEYLEGATVVR